MEMIYTPINARELYDEWHGCKAEGFVPKPRHLPIIKAIEEALAAGLKYTDDVVKFAADRLAVPADIRKINAEKVENGDFGMDCYYARCYIETQTRLAKEREDFSALAPTLGMKLGVLVFSDFKRTTGVEVVAFEGDDQKTIRLRGKRGHNAVEISANASQVRNAIERAFDRAQRKDSFDALIAANKLVEQDAALQA